jgi:hypothetical protein
MPRVAGLQCVPDPDLDSIVLFASYTPSAAWLYNVIDTGLWLGQRRRKEPGQKGNVGIHIVFIPLAVPWHLGVRLRSILNRWVRSLPRPFRRVLQHLPVRCRLRRRICRLLGAGITKDSLFHQVNSEGSVRFSHGSYQVSIRILRQNTLQAALTWLRARNKARNMWRACFIGTEFDSASFLALNYSGVPIGDLVASTTLSRVRRFAGSLGPTRDLFSCLVAGVYLSDVCRNIRLRGDSEDFVTAAEPTYLDSVPLRTLHCLGVNVVRPSYRSRYEIYAGGRAYRNPWSAVETSQPVADASQVEAYLRGRLYEAGAYLGYMAEGANINTDLAVLDQRGRQVHLSPHQLHAVVFLHSFDDGQYYFGYDGFADLFEWTTFTIDRCLDNPFIGKVLIKPHPVRQPDRYPCNEKAVQRLKKRYAEHDRVIVLKHTASLVCLCNDTMLYGITHHGSVAEEVVYLGQPMIGSAYAPWEENYPFLSVWRTITQYGEILDGLSPEFWRPPSHEERHALFRYVQEYRLNALSAEDLEPWLKFARIAGDKRAEPTYERFLKYNQLLEQLGAGDPRFDAFLSAMDTDSRHRRE